MNEQEARQHARDMRTVEKAVNDVEKGKYDPPGGSGIVKEVMSEISGRSKQELHDREVYNAARKEAKERR